MHDIFLSHNSADKPAVEALAYRLRAAGIEPWLNEWSMIPGNPWLDEMERALDECKVCAVFIGLSGIGPWQNMEMRVALEQRMRAGDMRVIPVLLPGAKRDKRSILPTFLTTATWVEFRDTLEDEEAFHRLLSGIRGVAPGALSSGGDFTSDVCPYRGLQVFDVEHAPLFFGRRALTEWLLEAIRPEEGKANRFLAMLGASGSGKSSLARAGLLAPLQKGELADSQHWPQVILKPGAKPLESLAVALCHADVTDKNQGELIELFQQNASQLHWLCRQALHGQSDNRRIVVLVDQFEEVFTLCHDEAERAAFINNLLTAATDVTGQAIVLLTLRADFYGKCAAYPQLAAALSDDQFLISPMTEAELREAIEMPALRSGCELEAGLVDVLLKDVEDQPGSLPLLEYTLTRLWEQRSSRVLRLADYRELGGLEGALNQRADAVYAGLSAEQQGICRGIFLRLVQPGEGTQDTRRRASLGEFGDDTETATVVQKLADVRLISTRKAEGESQDAFAEVAHEALIRNWEQLTEWIEADRESLKQRTRVSEASAEWEQNGCDDAWLLTGTRLQLAEEWLEDNTGGLSAEEDRFLKQSREAHEQQLMAEKAEQEKQAQLLRDKAELEEKQRQMAEQKVQDQKKSLVRTRWLSGLMAVLALLMVVAAGFAWQSADKADIAKQQAQVSAEVALKKEAEATQNLLEANYNLAKAFEEKVLPLLPSDDVLSGKKSFDNQKLREAWLYSLEAAQQNIPADKVEVGSTLFGRLSLLPEQYLSTPRIQTPALNIGRVYTLAYSPDGKFIASGSLEENVLRVWDAASGESVQVMQGHSEGVSSVSYSPDGKFITSGSGDRTVRIWDVVSGESVQVMQGHSEAVWSVSYSPDGKFITSGSGDRTVRIWDVVSGESVQAMQGHGGRVLSVSYSPDGKFIASGSDDGTVRVWGVANGESVQLMKGDSGVIDSVAYSPDGKFIASSDYNTLRVWDVASGESVQVMQSHKSISSVSYSPSGKFIASGSEDNTVRFWDAASGESVQAISEAISPVSYSPDGKFIASGSAGNTMRVWDVASGESVQALQGHSTAILSVSYSPDGKFIASGSDDNTVRIWDATSGESVQVISGAISPVSYSPDGKFIVSGSEDNTVRVWDATSGESVQVMQGHRGAISSVFYSPDGKFIASGLHDNTVRIWDAANGESVQVMQGHSDWVDSVSYSPDGKFIASGSEDNTVRVWGATSGESVQVMQGHRGAISSVSYSPDGKFIASGSYDNTVRTWDAASGESVEVMQGHSDGDGDGDGDGVGSVSYSPDGKFIASGSDDNTLRVWDAASGESVQVMQGHSGTVSSVSYSPDGKFIASGSEDQKLRVWDVVNSDGVQVMKGHNSTVSPDGKFIASGSDDNTLRVWDAASGESVQFMQGHSAAIQSVSYSPDGKFIASGSEDSTVRVWDVASGESVKTLLTLQALKGHTGTIWSVSYSPDGRFIASGSDENMVRVWDAASGESVQTLQGHSGAVVSVSYSPDGKFIASGSYDKEVRVWDAASGESVQTLQGHSGMISSVSYSPDGKFIASGAEDKTVRVWDAVNGESVQVLQGHSGMVFSVSYSPDGKFIASGSEDKTVRVWDAASGESVQTLQGHNDMISSVSYSPDGKFIASGSEDKTVRIWNLKKPTHRLLFDFKPEAVSEALGFLWELKREGLEIVRNSHPPSLFPQMGHHITFTDKTRKFRPLLDAPRPDETKLAQVVRFLEERCAYKHPERYNCTPATD